MNNREIVFYGFKTKETDDFSELVRYKGSEQAERLIVNDLLGKLDLRPDSSLLDIACGPGNLLIPLSFHVARSVGIDHPGMISRFKQRFSDNTLTLIEGNFLDIQLKGYFDRILCYSVLQCLDRENDVWLFIEKSLSLLSPKGRLVLGDIPNHEKKQRFLQSERGQAFHKQWVDQTDRDEKLSPPQKSFFSDAFVLEILLRIRKMGWHAYVCDQDQRLPFGNSREDIVVVGPEYDQDRADF